MTTDLQPSGKTGSAIRPLLSFRVGVTGHRLHRFDEDSQAMLLAVSDELFRLIRGEAEAIRKEYAPDIYEDADPQLKVLSALAEGTDRFVAQVGLQNGWRLECVLPFARDLYERDFAEPGSRQEYRRLLAQASAVLELGYSPDGEAGSGYRAVGQVLVRNSDLLVAFWDGEPTRGAGGGTEEVVKLALTEGVPVLWLPQNQQAGPPRLLLPTPTGSMEAVEGLSWQNAAARQIRATLCPPTPSEDLAGEAGRRLRRFIHEPPRPVNPGFILPLFQWAFAGRRPRKTDLFPVDETTSAEQAWLLGAEDAGGDPNDLAGKREEIHRFLIRADLLAVYFAQVYRSIGIFNFAGAALAVLMALMGLVLPGLKMLWISIELALIISVVGATMVGRRRQLHERWLEYRYLAERLRAMRYLSLVGGGAGGRKPVFATNGPAEKWTDWFLQAVARQTGLPNGSLDRNRLERYRSVVARQVMEQADYHRGAARSAGQTNHRLHMLGEALLYLTTAICLGYMVAVLVAEKVPPDWKILVTFLTALFPTLGAALFGIRAHGDFEGVASRSSTTAGQLVELADHLHLLAPDFMVLFAAFEFVREAKMSELQEWRVVFQQRRLAVPA